MVGRAAQGNPWALAEIMGDDAEPTARRSSASSSSSSARPCASSASTRDRVPEEVLRLVPRPRPLPEAVQAGARPAATRLAEVEQRLLAAARRELRSSASRTSCRKETRSCSTCRSRSTAAADEGALRRATSGRGAGVRRSGRAGERNSDERRNGDEGRPAVDRRFVLGRRSRRADRYRKRYASCTRCSSGRRRDATPSPNAAREESSAAASGPDPAADRRTGARPAADAGLNGEALVAAPVSEDMVCFARCRAPRAAAPASVTAWRSRASAVTGAGAVRLGRRQRERARHRCRRSHVRSAHRRNGFACPLGEVRAEDIEGAGSILVGGRVEFFEFR